MPKKFFDIIPPEKVTESLSVKSDSVTLERVGSGVKKNKYFLKTFIFLISFLIIIGIIGVFFFSKLEIEIWPKTDVIAFEEIIIIDLNKENLDEKNNVISGIIISDEKVVSQEFLASGKAIKEQKARGIIKIYNAYSTSSRTLIPSRFVSADGKLFWSLKKVTLPGAKYEKGKLVPSEIDVEVEASESGEEYNIEPTTFALPALAGTALYTSIYGRSFSPMTGGFKGEVAQITQNDLNSAEIILIDNLKRDNKELLKTSASSDLILLDDTIEQEILEIKSSHEAEAKTERFNLEAKIRSQGLAFKKSDINSFIENNINLNIGEGKKIQEGTLEINYLLKEIDLEAGKMILSLNVKAKVYTDIDLNNIKKAILGKSVKEAELFLNGLPEITNIKFNSWPLAKKDITEDINKLEVKLNLD